MTRPAAIAALLLAAIAVSPARAEETTSTAPAPASDDARRAAHDALLDQARAPTTLPKLPVFGLDRLREGPSHTLPTPPGPRPPPDSRGARDRSLDAADRAAQRARGDGASHPPPPGGRHRDGDRRGPDGAPPGSPPPGSPPPGGPPPGGPPPGGDRPPPPPPP